MAAKKRGNCKKWGRVKTGPRKGLCRKGPAAKKRSRKSAKKRGRRANCEKFGYSERLGRCCKAPCGDKRRRAGSVTSAGAASVYGPYREGYRLPAGAGPWSDAYRTSSAGAPGPWA